MIELSNIRFSYSKKHALFENLDLCLTSGQIYGLLGKNGAGKTTLLKIMVGLCFPQGGTPLILNKRAEFRYPEVLQNIFFLPEEIYSPPLNIKKYAKAYSSFYPDFNYLQFESYLQDFEVDGKNHISLNKLSYGQRKKVHIAFALAANTQVLIMDEPTNGLDIPSKSIFRKMLAGFAGNNRLVIISTHQVRDLHSLIDAVIVLDEGKILISSSNEIITEKLYFGLENNENDLKSVLYREENIRGTLVVKENIDQKDSKLDLELFFNAVIANKEKMEELFNSKK